MFFRHSIHSYGRVKMTSEGRICKKKYLQPYKSSNPLNILCVFQIQVEYKSCITQMNTQYLK